jgi:hypothetical protein
MESMDVQDIGEIYADVTYGTGDMKTNPAKNTNIAQNDVSSTLFSSKKISDVGDSNTMASANKKEDLQKSADFVDPESNAELDSQLVKIIMNYSGSTENPHVAASYGNSTK